MNEAQAMQKLMVRAEEVITAPTMRWRRDSEAEKQIPHITEAYVGWNGPDDWQVQVYCIGQAAMGTAVLAAALTVVNLSPKGAQLALDTARRALA